MYDLQLIQFMLLHYRHGFHSRLTELNKILRYFLGGERPTQTAHQKLSLVVFSAEVRKYNKQNGYFTDDSIRAETLTSKSDHYATYASHILNIKLQ